MSNSRFLFIDDDYMTIVSLVEHCKLSGHIVDVTGDILDAMHLLKVKKYSYILLDIMFAPANQFTLDETTDARYTGLRLLQLIKEDKEFELNSLSKIALITNWRDEPEIDRFAEKYKVRIFRKPLSMSLLEDELIK